MTLPKLERFDKQIALAVSTSSSVKEASSNRKLPGASPKPEKKLKSPEPETERREKKAIQSYNEPVKPPKLVIKRAQASLKAAPILRPYPPFSTEKIQKRTVSLAKKLVTKVARQKSAKKSKKKKLAKVTTKEALKKSKRTIKHAQVKHATISNQKVSAPESSPSELPKPSLTIHAQTQLWLLVWVDHKMVEHVVMNKGEFKSWQGKKRILFALGDPQAVDVAINGEKLESFKRMAKKNSKYPINAKTSAKGFFRGGR